MSRHIIFSILAFLAVGCIGTSQTEESTTQHQDAEKPTQEELQGLSTAYFASGCFWCVEAVYESVEGVAEAVSGYAGGQTADPTYQEVGTGRTGHAEAVQVFYDSEVVDFATLVEVYYGSQNPTQVNGQGPDRGSAYRSIIFYENEQEKEIAMKAKSALAESARYNEPIATEIKALDKFYPAEDYHQDYEKRNPDQPYVRSVSIPRLNRFKERYPDLLKDEN